MDSPIQPTPISSFPPSQSFIPRKLPIKRKNQTQPSTPHNHNHNHNHHRIWTEQDEIQFLHNLLQPSSQPPSNGLSHPFTKSQLSDKLRRLRKKFRNISSKIDHSLVSPHDRKLYDLMKRLWEPQNEPSFHNTIFNENIESNLVAVLALPSVVPKANNCVNRNDNVSVRNEVKVRVKVKDDEVKVRVKVKDDEVKVRDDSEVVKCGMKAIGEVVDESLKMIRNRMMSDVGRLSGVEKEVRFEKRWREQRMEEFEVLAKRVKLIMENSSVCGK